MPEKQKYSMIRRNVFLSRAPDESVLKKLRRPSMWFCADVMQQGSCLHQWRPVLVPASAMQGSRMHNIKAHTSR
ncbi:hypothetical protein AJ79_05363 [Helicocarpus griseus UAMH5409]|uniref:Uncharacterized protein n=1 Tax=Helicocarpus griseus UAMH5409 TaxID=1447875 RepID=A0A2B7XNU4_9EURO|nr:hypothetical protein AJ79_05363 [Helicocarpus griseus UAMH5409]